MKQKLQARMGALSFTEKIKILEKLRDREKALAAAGLRSTKDGGTKQVSENAAHKEPRSRAGKL